MGPVRSPAGMLRHLPGDVYALSAAYTVLLASRGQSLSGGAWHPASSRRRLAQRSRRAHPWSLVSGFLFRPGAAPEGPVNRDMRANARSISHRRRQPSPPLAPAAPASTTAAPEAARPESSSQAPARTPTTINRGARPERRCWWRRVRRPIGGVSLVRRPVWVAPSPGASRHRPSSARSSSIKSWHVVSPPHEVSLPACLLMGTPVLVNRTEVSTVALSTCYSRHWTQLAADVPRPGRNVRKGIQHIRVCVCVLRSLLSTMTEPRH